MRTLAGFINSMVLIYTLLIFAAVIFSWVRVPYSPWASRLRGTVETLTGPYLRLFRRFVPPIGGLDLSPMLALLALQVIGGFAAGSVANL